MHKSKASLFIAFFGVLLVHADIYANEQVTVTPTTAELQLYEMIMEYRAENGLPNIPLSPSLTYVAHMHVRDLDAYPPQDPNCNLHSWSGHGDWSEVCYTNDHANAKYMWNKPRELTSYDGAGYEIAFMNSVGATPTSALKSWKQSHGHNIMILNQGMWSNDVWQAIGVGIYNNYAVVWFGEEKDNVKVESTKAATTTSAVVVPITTSSPSTTQPITSSSKEQPISQSSQQNDYEQALLQQRQEYKLAMEKQRQEHEIQMQQQKLTQKQQEQAQKQEEKERRRAERYERRHSESLLDRYFNYSGYYSLSFFSAGYTYSFYDHRHMVSASILDFRLTLWGLSPLCAELSVSPWDVRVSYKPTMRLYIPMAKCFSLVPYGGVAVDASYLGQYIVKDYDYEKERDFYLSAIGGVSFYLTAVKHVPMELKVEYRHPLITPSRGEFHSKGIYLSYQIYFGKEYKK